MRDTANGKGGSVATTEADELLTLNDVRRRLRIGRTKSYELVRDGDVRAVRVGRAIRVSRRSVEEYIARNAYRRSGTG